MANITLVNRIGLRYIDRMRTKLFDFVEAGRLREGQFGSDPQDGLNGAFIVMGPRVARLRIVASDGSDPVAQDWEHVSVSVEVTNRCPNWPEMVYVKNLFWEEEECVVQFHPPKSEYVNFHPTTLHLWRHRSRVVETPPSILVGPK